MFRNDPFAVVTGELAAHLKSAGAHVRCVGDDLFVQHEGCSARVKFRHRQTAWIAERVDSGQFSTAMDRKRAALQ
jgi:hypothetical protein